MCAAVLVASACVPGADTQPVATAAAESEAGGLTDLERYHAIEEIKQLKARYFRHIDGKDWDSWQDVFTPAAELVMSFEGDGPGTPDGGGQVLQGWGHYHETYERSDGQWRIKTLRLTRLRVDGAVE